MAGSMCGYCATDQAATGQSPVEPLVIRPAQRSIEESLELWMTKHEDHLQRITERLEILAAAAAAAPTPMQQRGSFASSRHSAWTSLYTPGEDEEQQQGEDGDRRVTLATITTSGTGVTAGTAPSYTGKKTLRSMSDLFSTPDETRQRKRDQLMAEDVGFGARKSLQTRVRQSCRKSAVEFVTSGGTCQSKLRTLIQSIMFQVVSALMIIINGAAIGIDVDYQARNGESLTELATLVFLINVWYIVEIVLRMIAYRLEFFTSEERAWNVFDLVLGSLSVAELFLPSEHSKGSSLLRVVRIVRLFRCLRLVRWLRHMREFRKMIFSMLVSVQTLLWAIVLLFFLLYFFGIWFTSVCSQYLQAHPEEKGGDVDGYFGSLLLSMYSLWLSISGGMNWYYVILPLFKVDRWLVGLFVGFIATMLLGVMNIVTSVFVESAMRSTQHYRDLMLQEKARTKEVLAKHLRQIFHQMDKDGSGMISLDEMRGFLDDDTLQLQNYFEALEVNAEDAKALFKLLDRDDSGEIDIEEFCDGCMRLKGEARSFDINCLLYKTQRMDGRLQDLGEGLDTVLGLVGDVLISMSGAPINITDSQVGMAEEPGTARNLGSIGSAGFAASTTLTSRRNSLRGSLNSIEGVASSRPRSRRSVQGILGEQDAWELTGASFKEHAERVRRISFGVEAGAFHSSEDPSKEHAAQPKPLAFTSEDSVAKI